MGDTRQIDAAGLDLDRLLEEMGVDLRQVTWGYQELFRSIIARLARQRALGPANREVTAAFAEVLRHSDKSTFDTVVKAFLEALDSPFGWLMRLPRLFERWCKTGLRLARSRHFLGMRFFEASGKGLLGRTPAEIEFVLDMLSLLLEKEPELAGPFMQGYPVLREHLSPEDVRTFVLDVWRLFHQNPATARAFMTCELASARRRIEQLSRQARLSTLQDGLKRILVALLGRDIELDNLGRLDADELQERGSVFIACSAGVYVPETICEFRTRRENAACFKALVCLAACALQSESFAAVHGAQGIEQIPDVFAGTGLDRHALGGMLYLVEAARVLRDAENRFPGIAGRIRTLVRLEFELEPLRTEPDLLLAHSVGAPSVPPLETAQNAILRALLAISRTAKTWRGARDRVLELARAHPEVTGPFRVAPRPVCFFPDPFFPLTISTPRADRAMVDLHDARLLPPDQHGPQDASQTAAAPNAVPDGDAGSNDDLKDRDGKKQEEGNRATVGFFYDEWNTHCGDYYHNWCCVHELRPKGTRRVLSLPPAVHAYADRVRRVFELLKPEEVRREERLLEGDDIHLDHFVEYVSQGDRKQDTQMRFYTKPLTKRRDVAVAILLDLSGSTADKPTPTAAGSPRRQRPKPETHPLDTGRDQERTVLDVEKEAAFILACGLDSLGDAFALFGFTGTGRENCQFYIFKDFDEPWNGDTVRELLSATPGSSTRIGAALRHAGWKLSQMPAKTKLLLLITDGKPCDQGYETETHYAHHDVRKAVQENLTLGIHTFCVSTNENTPADMELMFPNGRYLLLDDISRLPDVLSKVYLRLTR